MKEELDKKLVKSFPNLYADRHASMNVTAMCWGFPGDGWYPLIWELSKRLEKIIVAMPEEDRKNFRASQVKEKFGTLRFYMSAETKEMSALINKAENKSCATCERCGRPGKTVGGGWVKTTCKKHKDVKYSGKDVELDWRVKLLHWIKNIF